MPQPTARCNFINFPTIAAATILTRLRGRNIDGDRPYGAGRRRPTPSRGIGTYSDEVIRLLGSAHISSPSVWRDKEINHLFGCTSPLHFRDPQRPRPKRRRRGACYG